MRGIEVYLWNLATAIAQEGIQVDILTWDGPLDIPDYARIPGINIKKVPAIRYFQAQFAIIFYTYWLLRGDYQHVFVHFGGYGEGPALGLARLVHDIPFSIVFHFPLNQVPHRYHEFERWKFQNDAQHLISVSQATACEVERWAGRSCTVIGHGVDIERFRPDPASRALIRQELGANINTVVLISTAALEERKGNQWVIQAMPKILEKMPDAHFLILGEGPYREYLINLVRDLNLQGRVLFLGFKKDVAPYLNASDIGVLLSKGEASPISLLEYIAVGLPVLTSPYEPFPELIQPEWGQMVPEQDSEQVSQAIIKLFSDAELRARRGAHGRAWVIENNNWHRVARQYQELVDSDR